MRSLAILNTFILSSLTTVLAMAQSQNPQVDLLNQFDRLIGRYVGETSGGKPCLFQINSAPTPDGNTVYNLVIDVDGKDQISPLNQIDRKNAERGLFSSKWSEVVLNPRETSFVYDIGSMHTESKVTLWTDKATGQLTGLEVDPSGWFNDYYCRF